MASSAPQPLTWVWAGALGFAALLGLVIGGSPFVPRDVPLADRHPAAATATTTTSPSSPTTAGG